MRPSQGDLGEAPYLLVNQQVFGDCGYTCQGARAQDSRISGPEPQLPHPSHLPFGLTRPPLSSQSEMAPWLGL